MLVISVLMVFAGLFGIFNTLFMAMTFGVQIGLAFVVGGIVLIQSTLWQQTRLRT